MKRNYLLLLGIFITIGVVGAGTFTAVRLIGAQASSEPQGARVLEFVEDDGSGSPRSVRVIVDPAPELPDQSPEVSGIFVRRQDNSLFVGTGAITLDVEINNGEPQVFLSNSGPEVEVVLTHDTEYYVDVTDLQANATNESGERRVLQEVRRVVSGEDIGENTELSVWGQKRGDRVIAEVLVYSHVDGSAFGLK